MLKKLKVLLVIVGSLLFPGLVRATGESLVGTLEPPVGLNVPGVSDVSASNNTISEVVGWLLAIAFGVGTLLALGNLIFGAYEWIMSGGKSDKLADGRNRMILAVVGLVGVALAYTLTVIIQNFFLPNDGNLIITIFPS
jgi:hypothetical protein